MQREDSLCRVAVYPKFTKTDIFDDQQFFSFRSIDANKTCYVASVVSKWILRSKCEIHNFGFNVAQKANSRNPQQQCLYLGFYEVKYYTIISISMKYYSVCVRWKPENNCHAHFQIEMQQKSDRSTRDSTKNERRNDRMIAAQFLSESARGPFIPKLVLECSEKQDLVALLPNRNASG